MSTDTNKGLEDSAAHESDLLSTEKVLDQVLSVLDDYVVFPDDESRDTVALWILHGWAFQSFDATPRLNFHGGPGSGKTRAAEIVHHLSNDSFLAASVTPAVLFRKIELSPHSVLFLDETDKLFGQGGSTSKNQMIQSVVNSGYRRTGKAVRTQGAESIREFRTFAPMVLSGIGTLPPDMRTRCICIGMKPTSGNKTIKSLRMRFAQPIFDRVKNLLRKWATAHADALAMSLPDMPHGVNDRPAEIWEPILAVADLASEEWGERARKACVHLIGAATKQEDPLPVKLLRRIREVFEEHPDRKGFFTVELIPLLGPEWSSLIPRSLSATLKEYDITGGILRENGERARGYRHDDFTSAWAALEIFPKPKVDPHEFDVITIDAED